MDNVLTVSEIREWSAAPNEAAMRALESGQILFLPNLSFALEASEARFLTPTVSDGKSKNVSFDPKSGQAKGTSLTGTDLTGLETMMTRYHAETRAFLSALFPNYAAHLISGRTSFRPVAIDGRPTSWRRDDRRLHVDAFPSQPVGDLRILRMFSNVNPSGRSRDWLVGENFRSVAAHFAPSHRRPIPGAAWAMERLGLTKSRRMFYDSLMLHLHDSMKRDLDYQTSVTKESVAFPAKSSWLVYTDVVSHAALGGQHVLEQTFYLPLAAMDAPEKAPQNILAMISA
jgi:hypothetical protein